MSFAVKILLTVLSDLQFVMGFVLNTCVLVFSLKNLKSGLSVNPTNLIYTIKGLVNIFLQLVLTAENVVNILCPYLFYIREVHLTLTFLILSPIYYSYWLTGWLCAHYCLSISNFTHELFVGFKRVLSTSLPQILLLSMVSSFVMSALCIWEVKLVFPEDPSTNNTRDAPIIFVVFLMPWPYRLMSTLLGCCLPFLLAFASIGFTTTSLIIHIMKMKQRFSGNTCPNLQVLNNTTRTMILFLTLSVITYITGLVLLSINLSISSESMMIISCISLMSFPVIEAAIIIQAIPKLRNMIEEKICARRQ
ncbi:taste receptor type 2 member 40-like [Mantella aurantiaca]